jgi:cold shock protein
MKTGKVKFFNEAKGFGFIVDDENKADLFVHQTGLAHPVKQNDKVTFEVIDGRKGPNAVKVQLLEQLS